MFRKAGASTASGWTSDFIAMLSGGDFRVLVGGPNPERLEGGGGVDVLIGLADADTLDGGANSDILLSVDTVLIP